MSAPEPASADRNLLFGILALQLDFVTRDALIAAMNAWVLAKERPLADLLADRGDLAPARRGLLEALVSEHLRAHGGDPQRSLAALSSSAVPAVQALQQVADPDVQASLRLVPPPHTTYGDPDRTVDRTVAPSGGASPRFRILRPHARGGLGEVFVAHDEELNREVALKEIQPRHADDGASRGRFLLEAEVTGRLEHPGVVPVYGLGSYADGRPYYAMRFVEGENLQEAIQRFHAAEGPGRAPEERRLAFRELLGRFVDVCQAVAFAHSRGVLHRDLKPGNVMLGRYGETLVVDWGLAKAAGRSDVVPADGTVIRPRSGVEVTPTQQGSAVGTPAYMSPEQAAGRLEELGPASDVYSLGATLYALLTGRPPVAGTDVGEVLRKVQRGEVVPPRQAKPGTPAALDAVCRKAMALRPADRYGSALGLAADVERWLSDEPVGAYREPWGMRAGRWLRRHRQLMTGAAALLLAAVPLSLLLAANREEARRQSEHDKEEVRRQKEVAEANERSASEREAETQAVLNFLENKVFAAARPEGQGGLGREVTLRKAAEAVLPSVSEGFRRQQLVEARLRMTLGKSFLSLGDAKIAADQYQRARTIYTEQRGPGHPDTLWSMHGLAVSYDAAGRHAEALRLREETLELRKANLGADHPDTFWSMHDLAASYDASGRRAEALRLREETLALRKEKLGPRHPDTLWSMNSLAASYDAIGRHAEALRLWEEALALMMKEGFAPGHPDTLMSMWGVARSLAKLGRGAEAVPLIDECLQRTTGKVADPKLIPGLFDIRLHHFRSVTDAAGCQATAEMWEKLNRADADSLYRAACNRAVTAAVLREQDKSYRSAKEAAAEAERAMAWLKQASAAGYKDVANLKTNKDLDALRGRADFQELMKAAEKAKSPGPAAPTPPK